MHFVLDLDVKNVSSKNPIFVIIFLSSKKVIQIAVHPLPNNSVFSVGDTPSLDLLEDKPLQECLSAHVTGYRLQHMAFGTKYLMSESA